MLLHPDCSLGAAEDPVEKARRRPIPTADINILENGATCDSVLNTWRWNKGQQRLVGLNKPTIEVPGDRIDIRAKRLDYIFASTAFDPTRPERGGWIVKTAKVGMLYRHPDLGCSLSDHFSVECTLIHTRAIEEEGSSNQDEDLAVDRGAFLQSPATSEFRTHHSQLNHTSPSYLPVAIYDEILAMIKKYQLRERMQRRLRLSHFVGSVFISIGCFIAVWWSPRNFVAFILMLLSTLGLFAGVIDGLIGGLFVGSEIRALKEFEWEISNARAAAGGEPNVLQELGVKDW
jgi:sphingomyelin phosphodiesterase 2